MSLSFSTNPGLFSAVRFTVTLLICARSWVVHQHGQEAELAHEWARRINSALKVLAHRPQTLLVLVNPFSGARRARRVWARKAAPVMAVAGLG